MSSHVVERPELISAGVWGIENRCPRKAIWWEPGSMGAHFHLTLSCSVSSQSNYKLALFVFLAFPLAIQCTPRLLIMLISEMAIPSELF